MRPVQAYPPGDPRGAYCLGDSDRRALLVNLEQYRAALDSCNGTITIHNSTRTP